MSTKTFRFRKAPDHGALNRLASRMKAAAESGFDAIKVDLAEFQNLESGVRAHLDEIQNDIHDHYNVPVEFLGYTSLGQDFYDTDTPGAEVLYLKRDFGIDSLDMENCGEFRRLVDEMKARGVRHIFVDFAGVHFISAAGIMSLLALKRELLAEGGKVFLLVPDDSPVYELIRDNSLTEEFPIGFVQA